MMNLRGVGTLDGNTAGSLHLSRLPDIRFGNSITGNLGAPLMYEEEGRRSFTSGPENEDSQVADVSDSPLTE